MTTGERGPQNLLVGKDENVTRKSRKVCLGISGMNGNEGY
jgi:hypothetical protein